MTRETLNAPSAFPFPAEYPSIGAASSQSTENISNIRRQFECAAPTSRRSIVSLSSIQSQLILVFNLILILFNQHISSRYYSSGIGFNSTVFFLFTIDRVQFYRINSAIDIIVELVLHKSVCCCCTEFAVRYFYRVVWREWSSATLFFGCAVVIFSSNLLVPLDIIFSSRVNTAGVVVSSFDLTFFIR